MKERGIVIGGVLEPALLPDGTVSITSHNLSSTLIRTSLLYWEKIDIPRNCFIFVNLGSEIENLIKDGILQSSIKTMQEIGSGSFSGFDLANISLHHVVQTLVNHNQREPGQWALIQQSDELLIPDSLATTSRKLMVELYDALPQPDDSVPLDKIIYFRERYRGELLALRAVMDAMYQDILNAKDSDHALVMVQDKLSKTLTDLQRAMQGSFVTKILSRVEFKLDAIPIISTIVSGGIDLPLSSAKMFLKSGKTKVPFGLPESLRPYVYLVRQSKELGVNLP